VGASGSHTDRGWRRGSLYRGMERGFSTWRKKDYRDLLEKVLSLYNYFFSIRNGIWLGSSDLGQTDWEQDKKIR
jgi:hypothetical protein